MTLFITKATPFIINDLVHIELPQMLTEYVYKLFNYLYSIHIVSKGFIQVNALGADTQTHASDKNDF